MAYPLVLHGLCKRKNWFPPGMGTVIHACVEFVWYGGGISIQGNGLPVSERACCKTQPLAGSGQERIAVLVRVRAMARGSEDAWGSARRTRPSVRYSGVSTRPCPRF